MNFFEGFFGNKKTPEQLAREQEAVQRADLGQAGDEGVIEYVEPDTEGLGPIVNEADERPRQNNEPVASAEDATEVKYENGIDYTPAADISMEAGGGTETGDWEDVGVRTPGDIRAQAQEEKHKDAA